MSLFDQNMSTATKNNQGNKEPASLEPSVRMKHLVEQSHNINVDDNIPISKYFVSGKELIKSAAALVEKEDLEKAFVLYLRYMTLFLEKIIHHPGYSKADKAEKAHVKSECNKVFDLAEELKKKIKDKYAKEYEEYQAGGGFKEDEIQKRSIQPAASSPSNCDIDEIDEKFNFSQEPSENKPSDVFDPFYIENMK